MAPDTDLLRSALARHGAGALAEAAALYRELLAQDPDHVDALQMLGTIEHQLGRSDDALALFDSIGLRENLTPQRSNGLRSMVERIRTEAQTALAAVD